MASPGSIGNGAGAASNLSYARFLFVVSRADDDGAASRLRAAGGHIARGFSNDFDLDDARGVVPQALESIQFFVRDGPPGPGLTLAGRSFDTARYLVHVSSRYRPRLDQVGDELTRRLADVAEVVALDGALRHPRYSSAEMIQFTDPQAPPRRSGRLSPFAFVMPTRKTPEWWQQGPLERHAYFYPHSDPVTGTVIKGHAVSAQRGIPTLFRRVYHNPDGYGRAEEFDFVTYLECDADGLPVVDEVMAALRDVNQNPEWRFVEEGPVWRGRRVLRW